MPALKVLLRLCYACYIFLYATEISAQDYLLFSENFEEEQNNFVLNAESPGSESGNNSWIVNNTYEGQPGCSVTQKNGQE